MAGPGTLNLFMPGTFTDLADSSQLHLLNTLLQDMVDRLDPVGGGAEGRFLKGQAANNSPTIDFDLPEGYTTHRLQVVGLVAATDDVEVRLRFSDDGGVTFEADASDYRWAINASTDTAGHEVTGSTGATIIELTRQVATGALGNAAGESFNADILIYNALSPTIYTMTQATSAYTQASGTLIHTVSAGQTTVAARNDAVRLLLASGNITSGSFLLYGVGVE